MLLTPSLLSPQSACCSVSRTASLSPEHLHCVVMLMSPNCRTVKRVANNRSPLFPSQTSFPLTAFSSHHNQGIHLNVSGVCAQRGWSKSPNRARNYAPSGREKCSESWLSCTTAHARHLSQVNKQTHTGSLEMMELAMQFREKTILLLGDRYLTFPLKGSQHSGQ